VDRIGRRSLTLKSQCSVVLLLSAIALCFYFAEINSPQIDNDIYNQEITHPYLSLSSHCSSYKYCFDCVQDENCGYCSSVSNVYVYDSTSACLPKDDNGDLTNSTLCQANSFRGDSCPQSTLTGWLIFTFLCLYLLAFAPGMGNLPWCINSEIYPTYFRAKGNAISTSMNWTTNLIMSFTFLTLVNALTKHIAFLMYSGIAIIFLYIFWKYLPETKDMSLESIVHMFSNKNWGHRHYVVDPRIAYQHIGTDKSPLLLDNTSSRNDTGSRNGGNSVLAKMIGSGSLMSPSVSKHEFDPSMSTKSVASSGRGSIIPEFDERESESLIINNILNSSYEGSSNGEYVHDGGDGDSKNEERHDSVFI
jgi:SP family myo-inositol transporter-like MFS transporter 13